MAAYVYLLRHISEQRFKIGKALDVETRVVQLGITSFALEESLALEVEDGPSATNLERILHRLFSKHRIKPGSSSFPALQRGSAGSTEWFDIACWSRVLQFLEDSKDLVAFASVPVGALVKARTVNLAIQRQATELERRTAMLEFHRCNLDERLGELRRRVHAVGALLRMISDISDFAAVVRANQEYVLTGEASWGKLPDLKERVGDVQRIQALRGAPSLVPEGRVKTVRGRGRYALHLAGEPGLEPNDADSVSSWCRRVFWQQRLGVAGFDSPIGWRDAKRAGEILLTTRE